MLGHYFRQVRKVKQQEHQTVGVLVENVHAAKTLQSWFSHQAEKPQVLLSSAALGGLYGFVGGKTTFAKAYATRKMIVRAKRSLQLLLAAA